MSGVRINRAGPGGIRTRRYEPTPSRNGPGTGPRLLVLMAVGVALTLTGCQEPSLDTRTYEVQYLPAYEVDQLIAPYVFTDRERNPGMMSTSQGAVTVRETRDNLDKIARVLEAYDRPRPSVMLHFQIIEANGAAEADPAISAVEAELRRLFRFEGYRLVAETQVGGIQGTGIRQAVSPAGGEDSFMIEAGVTEVRTGAETVTVTLDVGLHAARGGHILETSVTIPAGHSVVLGTANTPAFAGALILVVRAEIVRPERTTP
jgi:hypothetical protein